MSEWGATIELRLILPGTEETIRMPARITYANRSAGKVRIGESIWFEQPITLTIERSSSTSKLAKQS